MRGGSMALRAPGGLSVAGEAVGRVSTPRAACGACCVLAAVGRDDVLATCGRVGVILGGSWLGRGCGEGSATTHTSRPSVPLYTTVWPAINFISRWGEGVCVQFAAVPLIVFSKLDRWLPLIVFSRLDLWRSSVRIWLRRRSCRITNACGRLQLRVGEYMSLARRVRRPGECN